MHWWRKAVRALSLKVWRRHRFLPRQVPAELEGFTASTAVFSSFFFVSHATWNTWPVCVHLGGVCHGRAVEPQRRQVGPDEPAEHGRVQTGGRTATREQGGSAGGALRLRWLLAHGN